MLNHAVHLYPIDGSIKCPTIIKSNLKRTKLRFEKGKRFITPDGIMVTKNDIIPMTTVCLHPDSRQRIYITIRN